MDYLDNLMEWLQIEGEINILCRFDGAWHLAHPQSEARLGIFHIVSKGNCCLKLDDQCYHLKTGDVVFLPNGAAHSLYSEVDTDKASMIDVRDIPTTHVGAFTLCSLNPHCYDFEMFCGYFRYSQTGLPPLFHLPKWFLSSSNHTVNALLTLLQQESHASLGQKSVIDALCNVLFAYLIRDYLTHHHVQHGILSALQDKRLQQALTAMLQHPEKNWGMEELAKQANMSRANFIRLFKEKTGMLAGKFLIQLRLQKAAHLLKTTHKSVQQIAAEVGYQSEAHFSRVFKENFEMSPSLYRHHMDKRLEEKR